MTEQQQEPPVEIAETESVGTQLKKAREAAGLTQQALADKLFLKLEIIHQIETDKVSDNTSSTFLKGYIRLYAKNVGIDPEPLLKTFGESENGQKGSQQLQSFSRRVSKEATDNRWMMVTYFIVIVVIALSVVWWYQQSDSTDNSTAGNSLLDSLITAEQTTEADDSNAPIQSTEQSDGDVTSVNNDDDFDSTNTTLTRASEGLSTGLPDQTSVPISEASNASEPEVISQENDNGIQTTTAQVAEIAPDESELTLDQQAPAADLVTVVFTFSDDCWVNITDATGEAIAYGTKVRGRVMTIEGVAPFEVTLGAPQNVSIVYAGEPVDMSDIPSGRSARFNLPK